MLFLMYRFHNNGVTRASHVLSRYGFRFGPFFYSSTTTTTTSAVKSSTPNFLADFLVDSLGFSREEAITTSAKVKTRLNPKTSKPGTVVNFFEEIGVNKSQIKTLVSHCPSLLFSDIDKTLKPKIEILREQLGLSESDLAKYITKNTPFFNQGLDTTIRPNLDYLRKLLHDDDDSVVKVIKKEPRLLTTKLQAVMQPNIALLQNLGLSTMDIEKVIFWRPRLLLSKTELLADAVYRVEKIFHVPRNSPMFFYGVVALASLDESKLQMRLEIFRDFGWPDSDIYTMVRNNPYCLTTSDARLRITLNFFMKELGYESSYLASHPALLGYSFEKRVVPRNDILKLLKDKQLIKSNLSLYSVAKITEEKFLNKYVLPFRDELPEVYDIYRKSSR